MDKIIHNTYFSIVASVVMYAFGSGIIEVIGSPIMELLPTENKSGNMAVLHSFYCWGQAFTIIVTTLLVKFFGYSFWKAIPVFWAVIPFLNMIFFCSVPVIEQSKTETKSIGKTDRKLILILIIMLCSGASEISMSQWSSIFAQEGLGISKVKGDLLGPCAFAVLMGIGRVLYALFSKRISFAKLLIVCSVLCGICYFVVGLCDIPAISLVFCALCGITVSVFWPGTLSFAVELFGAQETALFGVIALFGDIGCSLGPWIFGVVADNSNLNIGFSVSAVFPILMLFCAFLLLKENVEKS